VLQTTVARAALAPGPSQRDERRAAIVAALDRCIRDKGYAHTSLNDVAAAARMSPSHLLYYFRGKEAILEFYLRTAGGNILSDVTAQAGDSPESEIAVLADYFFGGGRFKGRVEQGIVLELFGQAVHRPGLRRIKAEFDRHMKSHLAALFRRTPRLAGLAAEDAAETAFALLVGFIATSYFDERLELSRARTLFRHGVRRLAGFPPVRGGRRAVKTRRTS